MGDGVQDLRRRRGAGPLGLPRYALLALGLLVAFGLVFLAVEALGLDVLTDPRPWLREHRGQAAVVGVGLLVADVLVPVPSSVVMTAHGAVFGPALGTLLSLAGGLGAAVVAFWLGRRGGPLLDRLVPASERRRADALLERWGTLAIVVTRPVPLLAETVLVLAGASPLGWRRALLAALLGTVPAALLYALAGAAVGFLPGPAAVFALVLLLAALLWWVGWLTDRRR
ncbi:TVP38/TMEM64 family protein [Vallicoccus soli]|uniref:TVP38/TMEM64 family protein n=1 Tax=Vallicoccus soli TaxID=2339232 RepID=UPI001402C8BC|nr:VTT domain-containing protein [Vallicoccus soli]